jgi:hypothetical protein
MKRGFDIHKRREWEERFARHRTGGLTVADFCAKERVSVNTFYYWAKRVGSQLGGARTARTGKAAEGMPKRLRQASAVAHAAAASAGVVRFRLSAAVEVSVPANCLEAIRCLVQSIQRASAERPEVFQEVVVGAR